MSIEDNNITTHERSDINGNRLGSMVGRTESRTYREFESEWEIGSESERISKVVSPEKNRQLQSTFVDESMEREHEEHTRTTQGLSSFSSKRNNNRSVLIKNQMKDFTFNNMESFYYGSPREKIKGNIDALEMIRNLEKENRLANSTEQNTLAKYVGWGGLSEIFDSTQRDSFSNLVQLENVLTPLELISARNSVLTAYYTDPKIIQKIYQHLQNQGFRGGRILDPSMGTGNYFSAMPKEIHKNSELFGVELDNVTGLIAKNLHQSANIEIKGFQNTDLEDNSFDLVISNIPFSDYNITDKKYKKPYLIHEYFIKKSLDMVADGGVVCLISSTGFLDKRDDVFRNEINETADFKGAIRLPNTAFKKIAGTNVSTDILFYQKNINKKPEQQLWLKSDQFENEDVEINKFFIENDRMMLGTPEIQNFRGQTFTLAENDLDLYEELSDALAVINLDIQLPIVLEEKLIEELFDEHIDEKNDLNENIHQYRKYSYLIGNKKNLYYLEDREFQYVDNLNNTAEQRVRGLIVVRDILEEIIAYQLREDSIEDEYFRNLLVKLNEEYDKFVKNYGFISNTANERAFREDETYHLLTSIEIEDRELGIYKKGDMFYKATISKPKDLPVPSSHYEALTQSMAQYMNVNMDFINESMNTTSEMSYEALKGLVFIDHGTYKGSIEDCDFLSAEEYLSGDVKIKMTELNNLKEVYPELDENYNHMKKIQPKRIESKDINFKLGTRWIPTEIYFEYLMEIFELDSYDRRRGNFEFDYIDFSDTYKLTIKRNLNSIPSTYTYGTNRKNGFEIFRDSMNLKETEVKDRIDYINDQGIDAYKYVLNPMETVLARQKQTELNQKFVEWVFENHNIATKLVDIYNEEFNRYVNRNYDGSHIEIDGMAEVGNLLEHQKNMIARIIADGRGLMAHEVGAGKTLSMIGAGFKMKDIGLVNKPMYVVPNHLIGSFANEMMKWFPNRKILSATNFDFAKDRRLRFTSKIATGDYDAVIIGHSQFEKISLSKDRQAKMISDEIDELSYLIGEYASMSGEKYTVKKLVKSRMLMEQKLEKLIKEERKDKLLDFEELGVDFLFVDESHNYKNLENHTKLNNVAGVNTISSQRATDMYMKTKYLFEKHDHRGVVHATGTPISNSMSEMYTQMKYLIPDVLAKHNLTFFDRWVSTFAEINSNLEITPDGSQYQIKTRLSKFHNIPELMKMFNQFADIQTQEMLQLNVPKIESGKAKIIVIPKSYEQEMMMNDLVERSERIRRKEVSPKEDNMLKITGEARMMAIDPRLLEPELLVEESKITVCADKVAEIWEQTKDTKASQLIFSDVGTPNPNKFNVYEEIKRLLLDKNIPEEEIAFIHDAKTDVQKEVMFEKVRNGDIRILLGSTQKLGTGTNVQNNLISAHHIDCPWRPSDIIQRDGRIVRQGNINEEIQIYRYITKGTFDAFLWQIQEQKNTYISQIMTGKSSQRSADDLDITVLNAAEVKAIATDNPIIAEKMTIDNRVNQLRILESSFNSTKIELNREIVKTIPEQLATLSKRIEYLKEDLKMVHVPSSFKMTLDNVDYYNHLESGRALNNSLKQHSSYTKVGSYADFNIVVKRGFTTVDMKLSLNGEYPLNLSKTPTSRDIERIEIFVKDLPELLNEWEDKVVDLQKNLSRCKVQMEKEFEFERELKELVNKQTEINLEIEHGITSKEIVPEQESEKHEESMRI